MEQMRSVAVSSLLLILVATAAPLTRADDVVREIVWSETKDSPGLVFGDIQAPAHGEPLKVVNGKSEP